MARPAVTVQISDPRAAELLCKPDIAKWLKPFLLEGRTVSEAAHVLGLSVEQLHYRVRHFCQLGLLEVIDTRPRRGRASKIYRSTGTHFRFPMNLVSDTTRIALQDGISWQNQITEAIQRHQAAAHLLEMEISLDSSGSLKWSSHTIIPQPPIPGLLQVHTAALHLDINDAEALEKELNTLFSKYHQKKGSKRYGLLVSMAPLEE